MKSYEVTVGIASHPISFMEGLTCSSKIQAREDKMSLISAEQ